MRLTRWFVRLARAVLGLVVVAPLVALVPAALVDQGPEGTIRTTAFHLALAVWDPYTWECLAGSVAVAGVAAVGSGLVGVALGRRLVRRRFWGRTPLGALFLVPLAVPPLCGALGLRELIPPSGVLAGRLTRLVGTDDRIARRAELAGWLIWTWVSLAGGIPLVVVRLRSALARIDPVWEDAGRTMGESPRALWRDLIWPLVRPEVARAVGLVFVVTLGEAGAPLVLGLRRTLAFQVVEAATGPGAGTPRAAALALILFLIAALGGLVIRWWGRRAPRGLPPPVFRPIAADRVGRVRTVASFLAVAIGVLFGWVPLIALLAVAGRDSVRGLLGEGRAAWSFGPFFDHAVTSPVLGTSLVCGLGAALAVTSLAGVFRSRIGREPGTAEPALPRGFRLLNVAPPLVLGLGALTLCRSLGAGAGWLGGGSVAARGGARLAGWLDPSRTPELGLVWALALIHWPRPRAIPPRPVGAPALLRDAALSLGASRRRARRTAAGSAARWRGLGAGTLVAVLAATNVTPALLFTARRDRTPAGPTVLLRAQEPEDGPRRAAALSVLLVAVNVTALALAARDRAGRFAL